MPWRCILREWFHSLSRALACMPSHRAPPGPSAQMIVASCYKAIQAFDAAKLDELLWRYPLALYTKGDSEARLTADRTLGPVSYPRMLARRISRGALRLAARLFWPPHVCCFPAFRRCSLFLRHLRDTGFPGRVLPRLPALWASSRILTPVCCPRCPPRSRSSVRRPPSSTRRRTEELSAVPGCCSSAAQTRTQRIGCAPTPLARSASGRSSGIQAPCCWLATRT